MPNRKKEVGWYLLPRSGVPYHGTIPEGSKKITEAEAKKTAKEIEKERDSGTPVADGDGSSEGAKP